jgi:hypothetical protein
VFFGGLSDVEYWVTVTDHEVGRTRRYHNRPGTVCGRADAAAFPLSPALSAPAGFGLDGPLSPGPMSRPLAAAATGLCAGDDESLCLGDGRFLVSARWHNPRNGRSGDAGAVTADGESGYFWFFDPDNLELAVKVIDGRQSNGFFWVFFAALSDVEYWIDVTDTGSGDHRQFHNPPFTYCGQAHTRVFD